MKLKQKKYFSTLNGKTAEQSNMPREKLNQETSKNLILIYSKPDVILLASRFEKFNKTCEKEVKMFLFLVSLPGYTWDARSKHTRMKMEKIQAADLLWIFENGIRRGMSGWKGWNYVVPAPDI